MIILKADNDFTEKNVRDVEKIEESLLKERDDLLECSTVILLSMSTRSTILGEMWSEML